jgi:hypothetical protein
MGSVALVAPAFQSARDLAGASDDPAVYVVLCGDAMEIANADGCSTKAIPNDAPPFVRNTPLSARLFAAARL